MENNDQIQVVVKSDQKLTEDIFTRLDNGSIFAVASGIFPELQSFPVKVVAKKGNGGHDWAVYYGFLNYSLEQIARTGDKLYDTENIKRIFPDIADEVINLYRI